ncbi:MAG: hypothetical protein ACI9LU_000732, partial [Polaribacter sp.]
YLAQNTIAHAVAAIKDIYSRMGQNQLACGIAIMVWL